MSAPAADAGGCQKSADVQRADVCLYGGAAAAEERGAVERVGVRTGTVGVRYAEVGVRTGTVGVHYGKQILTQLKFWYSGPSI